MNLLIETIRRSPRRNHESPATPKMPRRAKALRNRAGKQAKDIFDYLLPQLEVAPGQAMAIGLIDETVFRVQLEKQLTLEKINRDNLSNWKNPEGKKRGISLITTDFQKSLQRIINNPSYSNGCLANDEACNQYLCQAETAAQKVVDLWPAVQNGGIARWQAAWQFRTVLGYHFAQMRLIRTGQ